MPSLRSTLDYSWFSDDTDTEWICFNWFLSFFFGFFAPLHVKTFELCFGACDSRLEPMTVLRVSSLPHRQPNEHWQVRWEQLDIFLHKFFVISFRLECDEQCNNVPPVMARLRTAKDDYRLLVIQNMSNTQGASEGISTLSTLTFR